MQTTEEEIKDEQSKIHTTDFKFGKQEIKRKLWQMIFNNPVVEKSKNKLKEKISQIVAHFPLLRILSNKELK